MKSKTPQLLPRSTAQDAIDHVVGQSGRPFLSLRTSFVQQGSPGQYRGGPLAVLVKKRDERALDLYLLMRLLAVKEPFDATQPAAGWARALNIVGPSAEATVSRIWSRLVKYNLVRRGRAKNMASMTPLMDDGFGAPYARITEKDRYLRLPIAYWNAEQALYARLELPAKAMLLIALSLPPGFILPINQAPKWYGISADTALRGFQQLNKCGVIGYEDHYKKAPMSKTGVTTERRYTLQGAFYLPRDRVTPAERAKPASA